MITSLILLALISHEAVHPAVVKNEVLKRQSRSACPTSQFECTDGTCLSQDAQCNFKPSECADNSDESDCDTWLYRCDFENGFCDWISDNTADFEWQIHSGPTETGATGPSVDHTGSATGKYLYIESSSPRVDGDRARLSSPLLTTAPGGTCKVRFFYHMLGENHKLNVTVIDLITSNKTVIQSISTASADQWRFLSVDVDSEYVYYHIILEGVRNGYKSDLGLDDLSLSPGCQIGSVSPPPRTLRLVDGLDSDQGRVEVFHAGQWGTICDDDFGIPDANVICRELGFTGAQSPHLNSEFGDASGPIWLSRLQCWGSESSITACGHDGWGNVHCEHSEDAGVTCTTTESVGRVRLKDGTSITSGRVEVWHNNTWGTVCDRHGGFTLREANVVCRQLGRPGAVDIRPYERVPDTIPIWLDEVRCLGNESSIVHCNHWAWERNPAGCNHGLDVGVVCIDVNGPPEFTVRLAEGLNRPRDGRVEMYYKGQWGTVCNDGWDINDTNVVCRQLDLGPATQAMVTNIPQSKQHIPIWFDDVECSGTESQLSDCSHSGFKKSNCQHDEDVAIMCGEPIFNDIRLVNGTDNGNGYLQTFFNGKWELVCKRLFTLKVLNVVCHQLGFRRFANQSVDMELVNIADKKIGTEARCSGSETKLSDCTNHLWEVEEQFHSSGPQNIPYVCYHNPERQIFCTNDLVVTTPFPTVSVTVGIVGACAPVNSYETFNGNGTFGLIKSPKYPTDYAFDTTCSWTITAPSSARISVQVLDFNTERRDTLRIYDGLTKSERTLADWKGEVAVSTVVTTSGRFCLLEFVSDSTVSRKGFRLRYSTTGFSTCPVPAVVSNSYVTAELQVYYYENDTITYQCHRGYFVLYGVSHRMCQAGGTWSGTKPTCTAHTCSKPPDVTDGTLTTASKATYNYSETVTYVCDNGFKSSGSLSLTCDDGIWEGTAPTCSATCSKPPDVGNGTLTTTSLKATYVYRDTVTYVCDTGFMKSSDSLSLPCGPQGTWGGTAPTCSAITCQPPAAVDFAAITAPSQASYNYKDKIIYKCNSGYGKTSGSLTRTCGTGSGGGWSAIAPICSFITATSGVKTTSGIEITSGVEATSGVETTSQDSAVSETTTSISGVETTTAISGVEATSQDSAVVSCQPPADVKNAAITSGSKTSSYDIDDSITYTCDKGYTISDGSSTRTCGSGGRWSGDAPTCKGEDDEPVGSSGMSAGGTAGIIIAVLLLLLLAVIGAVIYVRKRGGLKAFKKSPKEARGVEPNPTATYAANQSYTDPSAVLNTSNNCSSAPSVGYSPASNSINYNNQGWYQDPDRVADHHLINSKYSKQTHGGVDSGALEDDLDPDVKDFLERLGSERYAPAFAREMITSNTLAKLTLEDLTGTLGVPLGPSKRMMEKIEGMAPYEDAEFHRNVGGAVGNHRPSAYQKLDRSSVEQQGDYSSIRPVYEGVDKMAAANQGEHYTALEYGQYDDGSSERNTYDTVEQKNNLPVYDATYDDGVAYTNGTYYSNATSDLYSEPRETRNHSVDDPMRQGSMVSLMSQSSAATSIVPNIPMEAPAYFHCPITNEIMQDPVKASDGYTYERASIMRWLSSQKNSPVTNQRMLDKSLDSCLELKRQIKEWRKETEKAKHARPSTPMTDIDC